MDKPKSIKYNFVFNFIRVFSGILFPMLTVPYLSRVLQPEGIGKIAFADSIIQYFVLIASLGIPIYGIREVAKVRNNKEELSKTLSELFLINILMTIIAYAIFIILFFSVEKIRRESLLFFIMSFNVIFSTLGIEWYYQGIEKYDYITIRSILVRIVSIILMFLLVKTKQDYIVSATIGVMGNVGSNLYNIYGARKNIKVKINHLKTCKRHFKSILISFALVVVVSIYIQLSNIMLGFIKGEEAVAYYSSSTKLVQIILSLVTSLGLVIIPRASFLVKSNKVSEYNKLMEKLFSFNLFISIPAVILFFCFSESLTLIFFGEKFLQAVLPMKIIAINIFLISLSNMFGSQVLYPNNRDKDVLYSVIAGAVINVFLNIFLIKWFSFIGAAISLVLTEIGVVITRLYFAKKYLEFNLLESSYKYIVSGFFMGIFTLLLKRINIFDNEVMEFFINCIISSIIYLSMLTILKENFFLKEATKIIKKLIGGNL